MEFRLKSISQAGIAEANAKAEVYRFLGQPEEAESICRDVLATDSRDQLALRLLGRAVTDQFAGGGGDRYAEAESIFLRLTDPYERFYYMGILHERRAKAQLRAGRSPHTLLVLLEEAMLCYEQAEKLRPAGNDDALLRWNRCVRIFQGHSAAEWQREAGAADSGDHIAL